MDQSYLVLHDLEIIVEDFHVLKKAFSEIRESVKYTHMRKGDILKDLDPDKEKEYPYHDVFSIIANVDGLPFDSSIKYHVEYMASFNNRSFLNNIQPLKYPEIEIPFTLLPTYIGRVGLDQELIQWRLRKGC